MSAWRYYNNLLHRYLGYACVGLTLVYAISGLILNHAHQLNPDFRIATRHASLPLPPPAGGVSIDYFRALADRAGIKGRLKGIVPGDKGEYRLIFDGATVLADLAAKRLEIKEKRPRPFLRPMNFLHLNQARGGWTICADIYCAALLILAISGMMVRGGAKGIFGPGGMVIVLGLLVPFWFLWLYYR